MSKIVKLKPSFKLQSIKPGRKLLINSDLVRWIAAADWQRASEGEDEGVNWFKSVEFSEGTIVTISSVSLAYTNTTQYYDIYFENNTKLIYDVDVSLFNGKYVELMPINYGLVWRNSVKNS